MSLATRCTSCGTVFRVVQDQLKVSEGWVRCGRCNEVFNALEGLFDLERDPPPEWSDSRHMSPVPPPEQEEEERRDPSLVDRIDEQIFGAARRTGFGALTGLGSPDRGKGPDFADARFDSEVPADSLGPPSQEPSTIDSGTSSGSTDADEAPAFVREAEREARWHSSSARKLLAALTLLLASTLVVQAAHHSRDALAARWPATAPALEAWCRLADCAIGAPRRLEDIVVESTALAKAASGDAFRLIVVLHNKAPIAAALPWVELSLTDANGELVARRALGPKDFRAGAAAIPASSETTLQAVLSTGTLRVTGYTVEIFYP
ncbi:zinc-ribbon and DUF3426 domain-containing protein [uncultured Piscinibacter sp.]|uniref:zinc-ribbon and DUF3426 domain-containing protein n=1 Tax=uncultured Piscinibacter sp. TaxID=1131835 RepID=UPI0026233216|nr:zinc-ribbon and DUF3426 domain-containing protein [uncultured Piscinibacter sp.]